MLQCELMATECTQETVLHFLTERGGRVKHADLTNHMRAFIASEPERKSAVKEAFKSYVDSVAVVKVENGEKYVCLRKRFRGSGKRDDGHHVPDSAAVPETTPGASVTPDNPRDECSGHAPNIPVTSQNKDAKQERPPASVCAGARARTPPNISQTGPGGPASPEHKAEMGNQHATRGAGPETHGGCVQGSGGTPGQSVVMDPRELSVTSNGGKVPCVPTDADEAPSARAADPGSSDGESVPRAHEEGAPGRGDSAGSTPKGSRKSFIRHMMSSSPQVRRSLVLRHSRHAVKSDSDSGSVNSAQGEEESAGPAVTLDPVEHEWMMCACDGEWDSLRRLLSTEPSLVSKKDFVTGFTCLHWAAKLGKHELIAQIVNFARRRGVELDVNARSSAGYTPLHLATMHHHIEVIKMLVGACDADVEARDYSGKKASQYLRADVARDVLDITGAEAARDPERDELALGDEVARWKLPRVLQANLRLLNRSASEEDDRDCVGGLARDKPLRRKSSFNKLKPRLGKVRAGITPIVHSTSHFERLEGATGQTSGPGRTRPTSNLYG